MKKEVREKLSPTAAKSEKTDAYSDDLIWLMRDPRGRRLMRNWIRSSGIFRSSYEGCEGRDAAYEVAFNEGKKVFGYRRLAEIKHITPEMYLLMEKEGFNA